MNEFGVYATAHRLWVGGRESESGSAKRDEDKKREGEEKEEQLQTLSAQQRPALSLLHWLRH